MKCINCGNEVQDGVVTCPFCNANLNNQVPVTPKTPVLPQDQNMVVTPEAPVVDLPAEPIAEVMQEPVNSVPVNADFESVSEPVKQEEAQIFVQPVGMPQTPVTQVEPSVSQDSIAQATPSISQEVIAPTIKMESAPVASAKVNIDAISETPSLEPQQSMSSVPPINNQNGEKIGNSAPVIEKKTNKKKNMIILIILAIVLVIVGIGVFIYFYEFKSADKRIEVLSKNLFSFTSRIKNETVELSSGKYGINGAITANDENISFDIDGTYGVDIKNKIFDLTLNANSIKIGEEMLPEPLNVELYLNDSKIYVLLQNFFDKYIYSEFPQMEEVNSLSKNDINYVMLVRGIENAFSVAAKSTNTEQKIEYVTINGKKQKANVVRIAATSENKKIFANNFIRVLANNKTFITEYAKVSEQSEEKAKEEILNTFKDATFENDPNTKIELYSPLIGNSFLGLRIFEKDKDNGKLSVVELYPIANGITININTDGKSVSKGQITNSVKKTSKSENINVTVSFTTFYNDTTTKVDLMVNIEDDVNPKVEKVNVKNSVDYRYLTVEDQQSIFNKISNYGNLGMFLSQFLSSTNNGGEVINLCDYSFNCLVSEDGLNNTCQVCDDYTQTCMSPSIITCPIG